METSDFHLDAHKKHKRHKIHKKYKTSNKQFYSSCFCLLMCVFVLFVHVKSFCKKNKKFETVLITAYTLLLKCCRPAGPLNFWSPFKFSCPPHKFNFLLKSPPQLFWSEIFRYAPKIRGGGVYYHARYLYLSVVALNASLLSLNWAFGKLSSNLGHLYLIFFLT